MFIEKNIEAPALEFDDYVLPEEGALDELALFDESFGEFAEKEEPIGTEWVLQ